MRYVGYARVSTAAQGKSGLGLEAQQAAIRQFVMAGDELVELFIEVETGKHDDRPQLIAALQCCQLQGATLLIAKLDRLSRDLHFISGLMKSDVPFIACDMPNADTFRLHIEATVAEEERRRISDRTRAALAAAKARGVKLGGRRHNAVVSAQARQRSLERRTGDATKRRLLVMLIIEKIIMDGITKPSAIACALNARGITTARGGRWSTSQVQRILSDSRKQPPTQSRNDPDR